MKLFCCPNVIPSKAHLDLSLVFYDYSNETSEYSKCAFLGFSFGQQFLLFAFQNFYTLNSEMYLNSEMNLNSARICLDSSSEIE